MSQASGAPRAKARPNAELRRTLGYIAAVVLFLVIFFSNFRLVGGALSEGGAIDVCGGRGYKNATTGLCKCINNYYGYNCHLKYCPFGKSWLSTPTTNQARNREYAACSNMGACDPFTGLCTCRPHYEGRACERYSCATARTGLSGGFSYSTSQEDDPTNLFSEAFLTSYLTNPPELKVLLGGSTQNLAGHLYETTPDAPYSRLPAGAARPCSGHGICRTMSEAAAGWNGVSLTRPPLAYTNWEADSFQGCICDYGWNGYDCGDRACPFGRDPQEEASGAANEYFILSCAADAGFFTLHVLGHATFPIPFDADPALLKGALEELPNVGTVDVKMQKDGAGLPSACGTTALTTTIQLLNFPGRQRTIKVSNSSSNTRQFPSGGTPLTLSSSTSSLSLQTQYKISCPAGCSGCTGYVYLVFGDGVSSSVDITAANAPALLTTALSQLTNLTAQHFPALSYSASSSVSSASPLCSAVANTITLTLSSTIGNIAGISILDSTYSEDVTYVAQGFGRKRANVTMSSNLGSGTLYECSNQGICDRRTGICGCFSATASGGDSSQAAAFAYLASSSDGNGNTGTRGDCGHLKQFPSTSTHVSCVLPGGADRCSGHGTCSNVTVSTSYSSITGSTTTTTTGGCTCTPPWHGVNCAVATCPLGAAWFDEATSPNNAHAPAECSNMGICDRSTGTCFCREGFTGQACDIMDCPRDASTGEPCSGHGYCETMSSLFSLYGLSYGHAAHESHQPQAWDAFIWQECVCYAKYSAGSLAHPLRPATAPSLSARGAHSEGPASSAAGAIPMPGWTGWDCSLRMCPKGDDIDKFGAGTTSHSRTHEGPTLREEQRVVCRQSLNTLLADAWGGYGNGSFVLSFFGSETKPIWPTYGARDIRAAIEAAATVGSVTITFPHLASDNISTACSPAVNRCVDFAPLLSPLSLPRLLRCAFFSSMLLVRQSFIHASVSPVLPPPSLSR